MCISFHGSLRALREFFPFSMLCCARFPFFLLTRFLVIILTRPKGLYICLLRHARGRHENNFPLFIFTLKKKKTGKFDCLKFNQVKDDVCA